MQSMKNRHRVFPLINNQFSPANREVAPRVGSEIENHLLDPSTSSPVLETSSSCPVQERASSSSPVIGPASSLGNKSLQPEVNTEEITVSKNSNKRLG